MEPDTIAIMAFTGFVASGLGALLWARLNRIEDRLDALVAQSARREEVAAELAGVRSEIAVMRSDLTQIALAVGARRPRASEG